MERGQQGPQVLQLVVLRAPSGDLRLQATSGVVDLISLRAWRTKRVRNEPPLCSSPPLTSASALALRFLSSLTAILLAVSTSASVLTLGRAPEGVAGGADVLLPLLVDEGTQRWSTESQDLSALSELWYCCASASTRLMSGVLGGVVGGRVGAVVVWQRVGVLVRAGVGVWKADVLGLGLAGVADSGFLRGL